MLTMNSILNIMPEPILSKHFKEGDVRGSRKRIADKHKITPAALCMFVKQRREGTI